MTQLSCSGLEEFTLSMEEVAAIPEEIVERILSAQADVVVAAQKSKAVAYGVMDSGFTEKSIKKGKPKVKNGVKCLYVTPAGTRKRGKGRARNAEIAFVNEYGTRHQAARPFIRDANEESAEATTRAGYEIYDQWLKSKDL